MMKKLSIILLSFLALWACNKPAGQEVEWRSGLTVLENNLIFQPVGGDATITLNKPVTKATCDAAWISVSISGEVVTLTAQPYNGGNTRYAALNLESSVGNLQVPVAQYGVIIEGLSIADISAPVEGLEHTQVIRLNTPLEISADADWIHPAFDTESGVLTITVDENTAPGTREGTISYAAGGVSGSAHVIQQPPLVRESDWTVTAGESYYTEPDFYLPVSVDCGASDYYTIVALSGDLVENPVEDYVFNHLAPSQKALIDGLVDLQGGSFKDHLTQGPLTQKILKLITFGDTYVFIVGFGENGYITGQYQYIRLTVKDTRPGFFDNGGEDMEWGTF